MDSDSGNHSTKETPRGPESGGELPLRGNAVQAWVSQLRAAGHTEAEITEKLRILEDFCQWAGCRPEELVARCVSDGKVLIKERKKLESLIEEFAADSVAKANTIRSFMIHNGVRMIPPKPPWL